MKTLLIAIVVTTFALGCGGAKKVEQKPPTPARSAAVDVELKEAQATLEKFLAARWMLARVLALRHVTVEDRENVWQPAFEPPALEGPAVDREALTSWYTWDIQSFEMQGDNRAIAVVEVAVPTRAEMPLRLDQIDQASSVLRQRPNDLNTREKTERLDEIIEPIRHIVPIEYVLVRRQGDWRVKMGWDGDSTSDRGAPQYSEKWWLERLRQKGAVSDEEEELIQDLKSAEANARLRRYDRALQRYREVLAAIDSPPEFVLQRRDELASEQERWLDLIERLELEFEVKPLENDQRADSLPFNSAYRPTEKMNRGIELFELVLHNRGKQHLTRVDIDVLVPPHRHYGYTTFEDLAPGSSQSVAFDPGARKTPEISSLTFPITRIDFEDSSLDEEYAVQDTHEYIWRFENWLTDGEAAVSTKRLADLLQRRAAVLARCPKWPLAPVNVDLEFSKEGAVRSATVEHGVAPFTRCVREELEQIEMGQADSSWTVRVQILPPKYVLIDLAN